MEIINKKRFLLCFILTFIFLSTNVVSSNFFKFPVTNATTITVYAAGSRSSGGGFKSSSFSAPKTMPKSSGSASKSSSGGFKSGGFSNTAPKSSTSKNSTSNNSSSTNTGLGNNNYSSGSRHSFIPIPIFLNNSYGSRGFLGTGNLLGGLFKFILFLIVIVLIIRIIKKSKRK